MAEETMVVKMVSKTNKMGVYIRNTLPTWDVFLDRTMEIRPRTAEFVNRDPMKVRVQARVLTGQKAGVEIRPLTSMLVLTPEQEATIRRYARQNAAKTMEEALPVEKKTRKATADSTPGMI